MKLKIYLLVLTTFVLVSSVFTQTKRFEADKKQSEITYQLTHPLHEVEAVSNNSSCWVDVNEDKKEIERAFVQAPVTSFNSGNSNRDSHAMEVVDAITYPDARFVSTNISQNRDSLKIAGNLTFHGVTKPVTITASQNWAGNKLTVNGHFLISLTAFNVQRPSLLGIPVKDELIFTFHEIFNLK